MCVKFTGIHINKSRISSFFLVQILPFQEQIGTKSVKRATSGLDFLKVVRMVFWSGVVGPGTLARASRSKARLVSKSRPRGMNSKGIN